MDSTEGCFKLVFDRRGVVFSSFGLLAGVLLNVADDGLAVASEFADSNFLYSYHFFLLFRTRVEWLFRLSVTCSFTFQLLTS